MGSEYQTKSSDALQLEVRQDGSFHMYISVWVADKTVIPLNACRPERFRDFMIKLYTNLRELITSAAHLHYIPSLVLALPLGSLSGCT